MTSSKSTSKKPARNPDAIALLKADHAKVKALFAQFESARGDARKVKLATTICSELKIHTRIEEEIFYPAAREALSDDDMMDEANVEHQSAKELISQIEAGHPGEDMWEAKVKVLSEYINHHVKEEETEMFVEMRKSEVDLKALGEQLASRKQQLLGKSPSAKPRKTDTGVSARM
jgi:hemerythrin superfamily protein